MSVRDLLGKMDLSWGFGLEWIGLCCVIDPRFHLFFSFSVHHALFHHFLLILGAGGRPCQPPARPGCPDPHWGADNWAAVIPWRPPAWRKARYTGSSLESCEPSGPGQTAQVVYPWKHHRYDINEVVWIIKIMRIYITVVKFGFWHNRCCVWIK